MNSDAGKFRLAVSAPERPEQRRARRGRAARGAAREGERLDGRRDAGRRRPVLRRRAAARVWYRFHRGVDGRLVARLQAGADLEAVACVVEKVRSQLRTVVGRRTDDQGNAAFDFDGKAGANYYVVVGQTPSSEPGPVQARAVAPEKPPVPPGVALSLDGGRGRLDPLQNPADAWSVSMERGKTYRFGVLNTFGPVRLGVDLPDHDAQLRRGDARGRHRLRAHVVLHARPDGGGTYPVLVRASRRDDRVPAADPAGAAGRHRPGRAALERRAPIRGGVGRGPARPVPLRRARLRSDVRVMVDANRRTSASSC